MPKTESAFNNTSMIELGNITSKGRFDDSISEFTVGNDRVEGDIRADEVISHVPIQFFIHQMRESKKIFVNLMKVKYINVFNALK